MAVPGLGIIPPRCLPRVAMRKLVPNEEEEAPPREAPPLSGRIVVAAVLALKAPGLERVCLERCMSEWMVEWPAMYACTVRGRWRCFFLLLLFWVSFLFRLLRPVKLSTLSDNKLFKLSRDKYAETSRDTTVFKSGVVKNFLRSSTSSSLPTLPASLPMSLPMSLPPSLLLFLLRPPASAV